MGGTEKRQRGSEEQGGATAVYTEAGWLFACIAILLMHTRVTSIHEASKPFH